MKKLTHIDDQGKPRMVNVSGKPDTKREATAKAMVRMQPSTLQLIKTGKTAKGDVLSVAQLAGIMAAKKTSDLIPLCHALMLTGCDITYELSSEKCSVLITSIVKTSGQTGVEMEALTAATVCALTLYDMLKAIDQSIVISDICLLEKQGGKSGHYLREVERDA